MPTINAETGKRILERTLKEARLRRARRRSRLVFSCTLGLAAAAGVMLGLQVRPVPEKRTALQLPEVPLLGLEMAEVPEVWQEPSALVLVVNGNGMEMKALNELQMAALARKPGCRFALTADAVMWVSEYGLEGDGFSPGAEF